MAEVLTNSPKYIPFKVYNRPYCLWGVDLQRRNLEAIKNIDSEYFSFLADLYYDQLESEHKQKAALAIRSAYGQALEMLFSLICSVLQAPECFYAWMLKYRPSDVTKMIADINDYNFQRYLSPVYNIKILSWNDFAMAVHFGQCRKEWEKIAVEYGKFWQRLSYEFIDEKFRNEYNSIKHGCRVLSGGFSLKVGTENSPSKIFPEEKIKVLGSSEFGNTFFTAEEITGISIKGDPNFKVRKLSVNWNAKSIAHSLKLISWSIHNTKMFLKKINTNAKEASFIAPEDIGYFQKPWQNSPGVLSFSMGSDIDDTVIIKKSREDIEAILGESELQQVNNGKIPN